MSCEHDWVERGSGPGFRWDECWLCGVMTDWLTEDELRRRIAADDGNRTDLDAVIAAFGFDRAELEAEP